MQSIFEKINKIKLEAQNKILTFSLKDTLNADYQKQFNKKYFRKGCTLDIQADAEKAIEKVKTRAFELVSIYKKSTLGLIDYITSQGYSVTRIKNAKKLLSIIEETPGFICEAKGIKALIINIITGNGLSLKSEPQFVLEESTPELGDFLHDFYLWLAQDMGLPGFEPDTRKLFIKYFIKGEDELLKHIHINQMLMLKQAVSRDKEAIEFVIDFEKINKNSKKLHQNKTPEKLFI